MLSISFQLNKIIDTENNLTVNVQGISYQIDSYSIGVDDTSVEFNIAPVNGDKIEIRYSAKVNTFVNLDKNTGTSRPGNITKGQIWTDLDHNTDRIAVYVFDGSQDVLLHEIDTLNHVIV